MGAQRDDLELLNAWRGGDVGAGDELLTRHYPAVYRFFANKINNGLEDLVQGAFARCVEGVASVQLRGAFKPYLFGICRHVLLDEYRARRGGKHDVDSARESIADLGAGATTILAKKRQELILLEALRALPLDQQILVELYYWENLSGRELGEFLGVPENTARSRVRLARERLAKTIIEFAKGGEASIAAAVEDGALETWAASIREQIDNR